jgi:hypothetical protein
VSSCPWIPYSHFSVRLPNADLPRSRGVPIDWITVLRHTFVRQARSLAESSEAAGSNPTRGPPEEFGTRLSVRIVNQRTVNRRLAWRFQAAIPFFTPPSRAGLALSE